MLVIFGRNVLLDGSGEGEGMGAAERQLKEVSVCGLQSFVSNSWGSTVAAYEVMAEEGDSPCELS